RLQPCSPPRGRRRKGTSRQHTWSPAGRARRAGSPPASPARAAIALRSNSHSTSQFSFGKSQRRPLRRRFVRRRGGGVKVRVKTLAVRFKPPPHSFRIG